MRMLTLSLIASGLAMASTVTVAQGSITVTGAVTQAGSLYTYNYTVSDGTGLLAVLDIAVPPGTSITGLATPGGSTAFKTAYDPILGLVSFLENNSVFSSTPLAGFMFTSTLPPGTTAFGVTLLNNATAMGSVLGPVGPGSPVPEPASLALCALGATALFLGRKRLLLSAIHSS